MDECHRWQHPWDLDEDGHTILSASMKDRVQIKNERGKQGRGMRSFVPQHGRQESRKPLAPGAKPCPAFSGGVGRPVHTPKGNAENSKLTSNYVPRRGRSCCGLKHWLAWLQCTRGQTDLGRALPCSALSCGAQHWVSQLHGSSFRGSKFRKEQAGDILRCPPWSQ